jgi:inosine-uridine nucleoside N-ribohydrolase
MKRILIDCDPGIDDALALMLAAKSPELEIVGVTTVSGNLLADRCAANARRALELIAADPIRVAAGAMKPLVRAFPRDPFSHGQDGLANLNLPEPKLPADPAFGPDLIVELARTYAGELVLVATGPLTNLALALIREPALPKLVSQLIVLGGAFGFHPVASTRATGDNPVSEWNIYVDPEAADAIFNAGFNLFAIGLDVAARDELELRNQHYHQLNTRKTQAGWFLLGILAFVQNQSFRPYSALIDSRAVAAVIDPSLFVTQQVKVAVETISPVTRGQTIVDRREHFRWEHLPVITAAADVDAARFVDLLVTTITKTN